MLRDVESRLELGDTSEEVRRLALAACIGDDALGEALEGRQPDLTEGDDSAPTDSRAAYLARIRAAGFRGIGSEAVLDLPSGPGLTLVIGRNGSGKSSFAEAVEFALTGDSARWSSRSKVWREGWRNLHSPDPAAVAAEFHVDGQAGTTVVERTWAADAGLDDSILSVRTPSGKSSLDILGWSAGLGLYRPFLPYTELGAMVDEGPTSLHDALSAVLGLDVLTGGAKRLKDVRLQRDRAWKDVAAAGRELADELEEVDDDRAHRCAAQLRAKQPDVDLLRDVVAGTDPTTEATLQSLRQLATVPGPDQDAVRRAADELRDAADHVEDVASTDAARDLQTADLLGAAREFHADHGDADCPVCGGNRLDGGWEAAAAARERELRESAVSAQQAQRRLERARTAVRQLTGPAPGILTRGSVAGIDIGGAVRAFEAWEAVPRAEPARKQASALLGAASDLASALAQVRDAAGEAVRRREDAWRPVAPRVAGWVERAAPAQAGRERVPALKHAENALKEVHEALRKERWEPIASQAKGVWELLRHRSNVAIEQVTLAGSGTRRRVEVEVTVDGVEGAALGVMSQGELHALALSLFLPRATLEESPFRFVVIDDPVQSMDPARVDGLARVLHTVAKSRQVLVFTHDDRLPEALRRLQLEATVLEVSRGPGSRVEVRETSSPWQRYLHDARAVALTTDLGSAVAEAVVPGFCRLALEAFCVDEIRRREIGAGRSHSDVETQLEATHALMPKLAWAVFGTSSRGGDVYGYVNRFGGWAGNAVRACNEGAHGKWSGDVTALVKDVEDLIGKLAGQRGAATSHRV